MDRMQILKQGAEAILYLDKFDGQKVLVKERIKKDYRISQIDEKIRRERTRQEIKLLTDARSVGVPTPKILSTDEKENKIVMEFIEGKLLKDFLDSAKQNEIKKICVEVGKLIGKLHTAGIIHGDLTTSNMIVADKKIFFIDFGLGSFSKRIEDQGVDMNVMQEALKATHYKALKTCWENIVKGYRQTHAGAEQVMKKVDEIEKRARYAERE